MEAVLDQRALVLNRSWVPIDTTTVRRAMVWLCQGVAKVVEPETYEVHDFQSWSELSAARRDGPCLHTVSLSIRVPEVMMLTGYNGVPRKEVVFSRRNLYKRDGYTCQYCGTQPGSEELTIDHVLPKAQGGKSTWDNCVLACVECNKRKANRTPFQARMRLAKAPVRPKWHPLIALKVGRVRRCWERFISEIYWDTPLVPE
ncbi:MAG: HNH endonuclease [Planctomycetes bacterium]|nr:HNH endonuclease [Planctomycetota bacterium]